MKKEYLIRLPWPPKTLSPNAREHWGTIKDAKKKYREACAWQTIVMGARNLQADGLSVEIMFSPPDRRKRDMDNMLASIKSGLDGVADVTGIDDSKWRHILAPVGDPVKGGAVLLHIKQL